jgi:hypothetical protein
MLRWEDVEAEVPDLAKGVRDRFEAHGLGLLATLRADGSPRLSGIEPLFEAGDLWLGMMPGSVKAADLHRDPRLALHSATVDKEVKEGDAKVAGRAVPVVAEDEVSAFRAMFSARTGYEPPPGPMELFRVDVAELVLLGLGDPPDHMLIRSWQPGTGYRRIERR